MTQQAQIILRDNQHLVGMKVNYDNWVRGIAF